MGTWTIRALLFLVLVHAAPDADFAAWGKEPRLQFSGYDKAETLTNFPALVVLY